jgi:hypothetical protein
MLTLEEVKEKDIRILIGLPMYGGMLSEATFHGIMQFYAWAGQNKVKVRVQTMGNESLISRARNTLVSMMMDDQDFCPTHLLFIDADIGFSSTNIERLILSDKDVVCGIYPRKHIYWDKAIAEMKKNSEITPDELQAKSLGYNLNVDDPNVTVQNGFVKVQEAATGMMLLKREVIKKMQKAFPERKYDSDQIVNGKSYGSDNCYDLFAVGVYETNDPGGKLRYLSEDYYFSRLWASIGGEIWADVSQPLSHFGTQQFRGHVGSMFVAPDKKL